MLSAAEKIKKLLALKVGSVFTAKAKDAKLKPGEKGFRCEKLKLEFFGNLRPECNEGMCCGTVVKDPGNL